MAIFLSVVYFSTDLLGYEFVDDLDFSVCFETNAQAHYVETFGDSEFYVLKDTIFSDSRGRNLGSRNIRLETIYRMFGGTGVGLLAKKARLVVDYADVGSASKYDLGLVGITGRQVFRWKSFFGSASFSMGSGTGLGRSDYSILFNHVFDSIRFYEIKLSAGYEVLSDPESDIDALGASVYISRDNICSNIICSDSDWSARWRIWNFGLSATFRPRVVRAKFEEHESPTNARSIGAPGARKNPVVAGSLSFLFPGAGQFYIKENKKGKSFALASLITWCAVAAYWPHSHWHEDLGNSGSGRYGGWLPDEPKLGYYSYAGDATIRDVCLVVAVLWHIWSAFDAAKSTK